MQEGPQLLALLEKVVALRTAGLRDEHMAFSFMKRRVKTLIRRIHLGYEYTGEDDPSRLHEEDISGELIVEQLGEIFRDMPPYIPVGGIFRGMPRILRDRADSSTLFSHLLPQLPLGQKRFVLALAN
jgi:hypothetical protein